MSKLFYTTLALVAASEAKESIFSWFEFGFCPTKPTPVGNFEPTRYQGNWYEIYRDKYLAYEQGAECVTASYFFDPKPLSFYPVNVNNQ